MKGKGKARAVESASGALSSSEATLSQADRPGAEAPLVALIALAEELGRLLARRELERLTDRRGYGLPELLLGALLLSVAWMLIARTLGWLAP